MSILDGWWSNRAKIEAAASEKTAQAISIYECRLQAIESSVGAGADAYGLVEALREAFEGFKREIQDELSRAVRERKSRDNRSAARRRGGPPTLELTEAELRDLIRRNMEKLKLDAKDPLPDLMDDESVPPEDGP